MDQVKTAIISTLSYSDIFDYPLTKAQVWRYLVTKNEKLKIQNLEQGLDALVLHKKIYQKDGYYFLAKRKEIVRKRKEKEKISQQKLQKAKEIARIIAKIPTVLCIGVSGSLAMENAEKDADIDLFVITKKDTLWVTRGIILFLLQYKKVRRKRQGGKTKDTICLNMLIDSNHLALKKERHNIYSAHEVVQMKPLFTRGFIYEEFLRENMWVTKFLPHAFPKSPLRHIPKIHTTEKSMWYPLERLAKFFQVWYMQKYRTNETIANGFVAFHPQDYKNGILAAWKTRKEKYL